MPMLIEMLTVAKVVASLVGLDEAKSEAITYIVHISVLHLLGEV